MTADTDVRRGVVMSVVIRRLVRGQQVGVMLGALAAIGGLLVLPEGNTELDKMLVVAFVFIMVDLACVALAMFWITVDISRGRL